MTDQITVPRELLLRIQQHLEREWKSVEPWSLDDSEALSTALRTELEKPAVEPVAGWKLVPVEPTMPMIKAAADAWLDCGSRLMLNKTLYAVRASINAAPKPAQPQLLTDDEIALLVREASKGSAITRDGSTSERIARAAEQASLRKNGVTECQ